MKLRYIFFFSSRRRHTRSKRDWSSDVCSSDLPGHVPDLRAREPEGRSRQDGQTLAQLGRTAAEPRRSGREAVEVRTLSERSEERRVGKECRSRWSTDQL